MNTSGNRDSQMAPRSVLNDFTDDALTITARKRIGDGGYNVSVGIIYRRGRVALCGLDE